MTDEYTEDDELAALRSIVGLLLTGIGKPVRKGKSIVYQAEHSEALVHRARQHFEGRKDQRLLARLEEMEHLLREVRDGAQHEACPFVEDDPDPGWDCCDWREVVTKIDEVLVDAKPST